MNNSINTLTGTWVMDPANSNVTFSVRHLVSKVEGSFGEFKGEADIHEDISDSTVYGSVDVTTINTNDEERDAHLRSPEFFDIENHPTMTFRTNRWHKSEASDEITLEGELTIRDVTRPVVFTGEFDTIRLDDNGDSRADLRLVAKIDRTDWGLSWNSTLDKGGLVLGEEVTIVIDAQAVRTDSAPDREEVPSEPEAPVFV
jgi:polyisoprenoid-binding protein YceI